MKNMFSRFVSLCVSVCRYSLSTKETTTNRLWRKNIPVSQTIMTIVVARYTTLMHCFCLEFIVHFHRLLFIRIILALNMSSCTDEGMYFSRQKLFLHSFFRQNFQFLCSNIDTKNPRWHRRKVDTQAFKKAGFNLRSNFSYAYFCTSVDIITRLTTHLLGKLHLASYTEDQLITDESVITQPHSWQVLRTLRLTEAKTKSDIANVYIHYQWPTPQISCDCSINVFIVLIHVTCVIGYPHNKLYVSRTSRHLTMDKQSVTSSETASLSGNFIDIALGSDFDGITDGELNEELIKESTHSASYSISSEEEDNINVTIREIQKTFYAPRDSTPKQGQPLFGTNSTRLASVVVVPSTNRESTSGTKNLAETASSATSNHSDKNRSGSTKRKNRNLKKNSDHKVKESHGSNNSLAALFSRAAVNGAVNRTPTAEASASNAKRIHSPEEIQGPGQPSKKLHTVQPTLAVVSTELPAVNESPQVLSGTEPPSASNEAGPRSYRDTVLLSLQFILCLPGRPDLTKTEGQTIKRLLNKNIEEALINRTASPIVKYTTVKHDGVYVGCADSACAEWLNRTMNGIKPWNECHTKLIVIPQAEGPKQIRTIVCVPTVKGNDFILNCMAQLNANLNVKDWIIKARRPVGSVRSFKTSLFIRMDEESVERLKPLNFRLNWIGGTVQVNLEKTKTKPQLERPVPVDNSTVEEGNPSRGPSIVTSTPEVSKVKPVKQGLTRKGGSASSGTGHSR